MSAMALLCTTAAWKLLDSAYGHRGGGRHLYPWTHFSGSATSCPPLVSIAGAGAVSAGTVRGTASLGTTVEGTRRVSSDSSPNGFRGIERRTGRRRPSW